MTNIEQTAKQREKESVDRDAYAPPRLQEFGPVGALTQGGTSGDVEMGSSMATNMFG